MSQADFSFSDLIAGYVTKFDHDADQFGLETSDGRVFDVKLTDTTFAELLRNMGEAFKDCTGQVRDTLTPGQFVYAYGIHYPEDDKCFEAKHLVFVGRSQKEYLFEKQDWWIKQITELGTFYLNAQFGDGEDIDYSKYRTELSLYGTKTGDYRQETDTISRLVYGFASAFMLTGEDRFLEAAEAGTKYLRDHFRAVDAGEDICYWYHAIDVKEDGTQRKVLASVFGDDYDALPAYEQIYALAGPVQTYRITGDPQVKKDADRTINLFQKHFLDREEGGYFSHLDPVTFDPHNSTLTDDRARKNWNSVGDHAPAYLINLYLATGSEEHLEMLADCADLIVDHFPDYENSAFVNERFYEDWSHDQSWGWQQNRAVVGHNLKIAWNLMRIFHARPEKRYRELAEKIAALMPEHGMDKQRGGWYDVVERELDEDEDVHRFAWHDRKAWWQQEQGILAYQMLYGSLEKEEYLKYHRESTAFYNAWFLDHDSGGIYFNVLANGLPYLMGTEREKGSHSMSGYHSFELAFLAATYTNLLIAKQPLDLHFKPDPNAFPDGVLRVAPDLLPEGSIRLDAVTVDGEPYEDFDGEALTVTLPNLDERVTVKAHIVPTSGLEHFDVRTKSENGTVTITLSGELDARAVPHFRTELGKAEGAKKFILDVEKLTHLSAEGGRAFIFGLQKMSLDEKVVVAGAHGQPLEMMQREELLEEVTMVDGVAEAS